MPQYKVIDDQENNLAVIVKRFQDGQQMPVAFAWVQPPYENRHEDNIKLGLTREASASKLHELRKLSQQFNVEHANADTIRARELNYVRKIADVFNEQAENSVSELMSLTASKGGYLTYGFSIYEQTTTLRQYEELDYPDRLLKLLEFDKMKPSNGIYPELTFQSIDLVVTEPDVSTGYDKNFIDISFAKNHFTVAQVRNAAVSVSQKAMESVHKVCSSFVANPYGVPQISR